MRFSVLIGVIRARGKALAEQNPFELLQAENLIGKKLCKGRKDEQQG
jgi:hypothetical protein